MTVDTVFTKCAECGQKTIIAEGDPYLCSAHKHLGEKPDYPHITDTAPPMPPTAARSGVHAPDVVKAAAKYMEDRAAMYDAPGGERSMAKTVAMFNTLTGNDLTVEEGWHFMAILKQVRSLQGKFNLDNYEDAAAYFALAAEAGHEKRTPNTPF